MNTKRTSKISKTLTSLFKPIAWVPVVLINAIAVWSYFAYVVILCFDNIDDPLTRTIYLIFYHPFFLLFMVSYWQAIMSSPGYLPKQFFLSQENSERYESAENPQEVIDDIAKNLPIITFTLNKNSRFCEPCHALKADRCHHCSMCQKCVLKMDHHCPWVNNCVGWGNYKYFILFLWYSVLYTMYIALTSLKYFIRFWSGSNMKANSNLHILFLFFISSMFSISLWSLLGFHIYLTLSNKTTLESFRPPVFQHGPDKNGFNLGKINNFKQIFGNVKWKWLLPIFSTPGNGYIFRTSHTNNPEATGLLHNHDEDDDTANLSSERMGLLECDEPTTIYTGAHFVNSSDIKLNSYLGKTASVSDGDDDDVEVFDRSRSRQNDDTRLDLGPADKLS